MVDSADTNHLELAFIANLGRCLPSSPPYRRAPCQNHFGDGGGAGRRWSNHLVQGGSSWVGTRRSRMPSHRGLGSDRKRKTQEALEPPGPDWREDRRIASRRVLPHPPRALADRGRGGVAVRPAAKAAFRPSQITSIRRMAGEPTCGARCWTGSQRPTWCVRRTLPRAQTIWTAAIGGPFRRSHRLGEWRAAASWPMTRRGVAMRIARDGAHGSRPRDEDKLARRARWTPCATIRPRIRSLEEMHERLVIAGKTRTASRPDHAFRNEVGAVATCSHGDRRGPISARTALH